MNKRTAENRAAACGAKSIRELVSRLRRAARSMRSAPHESPEHKARNLKIAEINDREADSLAPWK